ncbi:MAG: glutamyl-tRNA reductase [Oligoflexus sp.]
MTRHVPTLFCVGTNHEFAGLDFRESLFLEREEIDVSLPKVLEKHQVKEALVLSTCNRLEIYGVLDQSQANQHKLKEIFIDLQRFSPTQKQELEEEIRKQSYQYTDMQAVKHVFSVASGLDSLVLGETQITGQFKDAAAYAVEQGTLGPILKRMTQEAFSASKKVRSQTDISKKPVSISHAAIELANRLYGNISEHTLLIIGAGEMAEVAAKYAIKYKPKELFICNRTLSRGQDLADRLGFGQAFPWDELQELLASADIIISSTAANEIIVDKSRIVKAQKLRNNKPSFIVDIALPRDIDPHCAELDDVYLFDIDDLKQVVGENYEERRKAAEQGRLLIEDSATNFMSWIGRLNLKPALADFRAYLETLIEQEKKKSFSRSPLQDLNQEQLEAIDRLFLSVINKISGDAGKRLTSPPDGFKREDLAETLQTLFPAAEKKTEKDDSYELNSKKNSNRNTG